MNKTTAGRFLFLRVVSVQLASLAFVALATTGETHQVRYSVIPLDPQPDKSSFGTAINNKGQIVGWAQTDTGARAYLYRNGVLTELGTLGGNSSHGSALNNRGQVVGDSDLHAFLYQSGIMMDLSALPGGTNGYAEGINDRGQVICAFGSQAVLYSDGQLYDLGTFMPTCINNRGQIAGGNGTTAVLYSHGTLADLGTLGGFGGLAYGINDRGQVVGVSVTGTGRGGAFLFSNGKMIDLGTTSDSLPNSIAFGINNRSSVVGEVYSTGLSGVYHAFLYEHGKMIDLDTCIVDSPGLTLENAMGINDAGEIVANGNYGDGRNHAFLLKPVRALHP